MVSGVWPSVNVPGSGPGPRCILAAPHARPLMDRMSTICDPDAERPLNRPGAAAGTFAGGPGLLDLLPPREQAGRAAGCAARWAAACARSLSPRSSGASTARRPPDDPRRRNRSPTPPGGQSAGPKPRASPMRAGTLQTRPATRRRAFHRPTPALRCLSRTLPELGRWGSPTATPTGSRVTGVSERHRSPLYT